MFRDSFIALIRTAVPVIVGALLALLAEAGLDVPGGVSAQLTAALVSITTAGYYAGVTYLERRVDARFGWLLGAAKPPRYGREAAE